VGRLIAIAVALVLLVLLVLYGLGRGWGVERWHAGTPTDVAVPADLLQARAEQQARSARGAGAPGAKQILFGDLHVHSTFSADAFQLALPMVHGEGAHPVADACDFARYCSALDFWSINDHALALTPRTWSETIDTIRQCNAVTDPASPDMVTYLGWEWTQVGSRPENHYGHKNVILRDLADDRIPARPIAAGPPPDAPGLVNSFRPSTLAMGLFALWEWRRGGPEGARYLADLMDQVRNPCPRDVPVRDLPADCQELASTPAELFAKLDDWGLAATVIPHGTTWGMYTPPGSAWDKQLTTVQHDPSRQRLIEIFSGHGNSEEFRPWQELVVHADGSRSCPEPTPDFLPSCWRAGEIIETRCLEDGESAEECAARAAAARQHFADADRNGGIHVVPGTEPADWLDAGQCRDCFQPAFNYRVRSSVQYIMALGRPGETGSPLRFRFGFVAASDNHSARPGTGYKEFARTEFTEARFGYFSSTLIGRVPREDPEPESRPFDAERSQLPVFALWESERAASFFLNGGLTAVHADGRDRETIWDALQRKEVYGTSGPRILLWFDLLNAPGTGTLPMGGETRMRTTPHFLVRAVGSFEQKPGCPDYAVRALEPERLGRLCRDECYHPSDRRRPITRIEVVRIRPQRQADEDVAMLIEDPWRTLSCPPDPSGCRVTFSDVEFAGGARDAVYYVRAIEAPSPAVDVDPLGCTYDAEGRCIEVDPCFDRPQDDDCLAETEERAWSSPIFVDYGGPGSTARGPSAPRG
jgi:hypothetical protein